VNFRAGSFLTLVGAGLGAWQGGSPSAVPVSSFHFVDRSASAGLRLPTWCGRPEKPHILESGGTGLALFDCDGDRDLDLYLVNGWRLQGNQVVERGRNLLYRNRGDGTFEDITASAGAGDERWGTGVATGDVDGDGDIDLFASNFGPDALYLNRGDCTFTTLPDGPGIDGWSTGATLFDADRDGDLDLYVAAYIDCTLDQVLDAQPTLDWHGLKVMLGPFGLEGKGNRYFENLGGGRFRDATEAAGLVDAGLYYSFSVAAADFDGDRDLDLYVANDSNPNYLYQNDGRGHFQEVGLWSGAALDENGLAQAGMGQAIGDVDGDGDPDLLVTNFSQDQSTLYANLGQLMFEDVTRRWGLREPTFMPLSWGTILADFDLDRDLDLFIANGHIYPQADRAGIEGIRFKQPNLLLAKEGGRFTDLSQQSGPGLAVIESSRGVAAGDLDGDGDVDLVVANVDAPPTLLRNDSPPRGAWLLVDAPGALRVSAQVDGIQLVRDFVAGGSYLSASDPCFHFGLGPVDWVDQLMLLYPDGTLKTLRHVAVNQRLRIPR